MEKAINRQRVLLDHLRPSSSFSSSPPPHNYESSSISAVIEKTNGVVDPTEVGEIVVGTVLAKGDDRACNLRINRALRTVNRQCSSAHQAVADVAAAIKAGFYDISEWMSSLLWVGDPPDDCQMSRFSQKPQIAFFQWALLQKMLPNVSV
ncbi:hypothetical protein Tsubulata_004177 [Turnera subulata]|uniref:Thiolase N-terminal domain-containing protein n=1 Tax=Turnera subulata TaxID=218843 RepID=A0A9Q0J5I5_9ROSI|nr:hypothetical protein Tsubulata_004177 [Turnera subulata]